jgi:hypothetical protein
MVTQQERIDFHNKLHANLKLEWNNVTALLRGELRIEADVISAGPDAFIFKIGKQNPLSWMRCPRWAGMLISYFADIGDSFESKTMTTPSVAWRTLIPEVRETLYKHRNKITF